MLYTIIESFSPADGERWTKYCEWRGIKFERFDSIDGILRPSLCKKPSDEDWLHIVNEDFMLHFFIELAYAEKKRVQIGKGDLIGLSFDEHNEKSPEFLGYDLIDGYDDVSLLTNWGNNTEIINRSISSSGLISSRMVVEDIQNELLRTRGSDDHVKGCKIVSIYKPKHA